MVFYVQSTKKHLEETSEPEGSVWRSLFSPAATCPESGIYRCYNCGDEVTCNKGDPVIPRKNGVFISRISRNLNRGDLYEKITFY